MSALVKRDHMYTVDLSAAQLLVFSDRPGTRIEVLNGGLWLTEERCLQDRFIAAGGSLLLERGGRTVAEAIGQTRVKISESGSAVVAFWRHAGQLLRGRRRAIAGNVGAAVLALFISVGLVELTAVGFLATGGQTSAIWHGQPLTGSAVRA